MVELMFIAWLGLPMVLGTTTLIYKIRSVTRGY